MGLLQSTQEARDLYLNEGLSAAQQVKLKDSEKARKKTERDVWRGFLKAGHEDLRLGELFTAAANFAAGGDLKLVGKIVHKIRKTKDERYPGEKTVTMARIMCHAAKGILRNPYLSMKSRYTIRDALYDKAFRIAQNGLLTALGDGADVRTMAGAGYLLADLGVTTNSILKHEAEKGTKRADSPTALKYQEHMKTVIGAVPAIKNELIKRRHPDRAQPFMEIYAEIPAVYRMMFKQD